MLFRTLQTTNAVIELMSPSNASPDLIVLPEIYGGIRGYAPLLERLSEQGFSPVGINPRSCGASRGSLDGITIDDIAGDVAEVIRQLVDGPILIVGHAGGQRVARTIASKWPALVTGLVLLAAGGRVPALPEARDAFERAWDLSLDTSQRQAAWNRFMFGANGPVPGHLSEWGDRSSELVAALRKAEPAPSADTWWSGGSARMLVIQGVDDEMAPMANGHQLAEEFPDRVTLIDLEGAAHGLPHQQPDRIAQEMMAWALRLNLR